MSGCRPSCTTWTLFLQPEPAVTVAAAAETCGHTHSLGQHTPTQVIKQNEKVVEGLKV